MLLLFSQNSSLSHNVRDVILINVLNCLLLDMGGVGWSISAKDESLLIFAEVDWWDSLLTGLRWSSDGNMVDCSLKWWTLIRRLSLLLGLHLQRHVGLRLLQKHPLHVADLRLLVLLESLELLLQLEVQGSEQALVVTRLSAELPLQALIRFF